MRIAVVVVSGAVLLALAGCTSPAPKPSPSVPSHVTIQGTTAEKRSLRAPVGTNSATVEMGCEGTSLDVTVADEPIPRSGRCSSRRQFTVPVDGSLALDIDPTAATRFTVQVRFSPVAFHQDATLAQQCSAASAALSELASAVNGLLTGGLDAAGAQEDMQHAATDLLAAPADGQLGEDLATLRSWLLAHPTADPSTAPAPNPTQACADNESPFAVQSQFGG